VDRDLTARFDEANRCGRPIPVLLPVTHTTSLSNKIFSSRSVV